MQFVRIGFVAVGLQLTGMLSAPAGEFYPKVDRNVVIKFLDAESKASLCLSKKIISEPALNEEASKRLFYGVHKGATQAGLEFRSISNDKANFQNNGQYEKMWNYMEFITDPRRPTEVVPAGVRFTMSEEAWRAEKDARLQIATAWCSGAMSELKAMYKILELAD